ncbi:MAG: nitroreductase family protein, partial [Pseudomonadota bacterium]
MLRFIKNFFFLFSGKPRVTQKAGSQETLRLILSRRSCRSFSDEDIRREDMQAILEAGRFAPSTAAALQGRGHQVLEMPLTSGLQVLAREPGGWAGG